MTILRVNLSSKEVTTEPVPEEDQERYLGGQGVAAAIFSREVPPDTDPLGPDNQLVFSVGPYAATMVPFCGRHFVLAKSPATNMIGEASAGGFWGKEFRSAGFTHLIVSGKSDEPVYLHVTDGKAEIKPAADLWGKTVSEAEAAILAEVEDSKTKVACIGPAGENLVKFAAIMSERDRAAGRTGMGAVMGSKNLKAIAVRGTGKPPVADTDALRAASQRIRELVNESPLAGVFKDGGTTVGMDTGPGIGDVPIKNYTMSRWRGTRKLGNQAFKERGYKHHACFGCPVACTGIVEYEGEEVRWPEYETLAMLGANLLVDDLETIIKWNVLVNDLGMDTISLGGVLGMFLEAAERGQLDVDLAELGFQPDPEKQVVYDVWGATGPIETLITKIAHREGIGDDLAEGVERFCETHDLPKDFKTVVKGLEVPAHEPRANNLTSLDYATTPRGAFHCYMPMHLSTNMNLKKELGLTEMVPKFDKDAKVAEAVIKIQDSSEAYSACGACIFGYNFIDEVTPWVDALNAITGRSYTVDSWVAAGERIFNLKRTYNLDAGVTKADDTLGPRFFDPIRRGGTRKNVPPLDETLPLYYETRGWDENGRPT